MSVQKTDLFEIIETTERYSSASQTYITETDSHSSYQNDDLTAIINDIRNLKSMIEVNNNIIAKINNIDCRLKKIEKSIDNLTSIVFR